MSRCRKSTHALHKLFKNKWCAIVRSSPGVFLRHRIFCSSCVPLVRCGCNWCLEMRRRMKKKNVKFIDCTVEWKTKTGAPYFFFRVDAGHLCSNYSHHYHSVDVRTHLIVLHIRTKIHWDQTIKIEQWPSSVPPYSAFHGVHTKCAYRMRSTSSSTRQHQHSIQFYRFNCFISNDRVFPSISCFDRTVCKVTLRSCRAS